MRIRALVGAMLFVFLFVLLLASTQASGTPLSLVGLAASTPVWSDFQPSAWVTGTRTTCLIQVDNQDGLIGVGRYRFSTNGGSTWSGELTQGLTVLVDDSGTRATLTASNLSLPESADPDQNQIRFSIRDSLGAQWWSSDYLVRIDNTPPNSNISPTACYGANWPGAVTGTATDQGSGVSLVEITLRRNSDGLYYNGSSWQPAAVWLSTTGTNTWSYAVTLGEDVYVVQSRATDAVGHQEAELGQGTFSLDVTPPQSAIETAGCFTADGWDAVGVIVGWASDALAGVARVEITIQRASDDLYYNGSSWGASASWLLTSGTTAWSLPFSPPVESLYTVRSRATDNCGNVQSSLGQGSFTYDNARPQSSVATTGCFRASTWPGAISGSAADTGSGIERVDITVQRASDSRYYNGSSWVASPTWLPATGTTGWSLSFAPTGDTVYTIQSRATDNCGNLQTAPGQASFTYDGTAPQSTVSTSGCFKAADWPGAIHGSASDAQSGVTSVDVTIQRTFDGLYYNGSWWSAAPTWLQASGTTSWSLPFMPAIESTYSIRSRAMDGCGNIQAVPAGASFAYDTTGPQSVVQTSGMYGPASWPGAIQGSASDASSGIASVQITVRRASDNLYYNGSSWGAAPVWIGVSGTVEWSMPFLPAADTLYSVASRAIDNCGNVQSQFSMSTFSYDTSAPAVPTNLVVVPSGWSRSNSFTLSWSNPGIPSGIARAHYKWDAPPQNNGDESPGSPVAGEGIDHISGLAVPAEGTHRLYLWLEDTAGNMDFSNHAVTDTEAFKWDATPPVTSIASIVGGQGCAGWYTSTVRVNVSAVDATSGISVTFWRQNGSGWQPVSGSTFTVTGEGSPNAEYYSIDLAGNSEAPHALSPQLKIDSAPPTTDQPSYTGTLGRNGWYISPVGVTLNALDATSGVSATYYQVDSSAFQPGNAFEVSSDGVHTLGYFSMDAACNREAIHTPPTPLKIDRTPPNTLAEASGLKVNEWFVVSPVTVSLLASDAITTGQSSGVENIRYRIDSSSWQQTSVSAITFTVSLPAGQREGTRTIEYYATDLAGNAEPSHILIVGIDQNAPGPIPYVPIVSPPTWSRANCFTVTWDANPSDLCGIGGAYYSFREPSFSTDGTLVVQDNIMTIPCIQIPEDLGDGAHNVYVWLRDRAGNADHRTRREVTLRLDRTPPELQTAIDGRLCNLSGWYNSCVTVTFVAQDIDSGMAGGVISYQVNGGDWVVGSSYVECRDGVYRIDCRAMDTAGNSSAIVHVPLIKLDQTAPDAPIDLQVNPNTWSRENTFTISWLNPGDFSGLAGVCYKQGSPPVSPTDGVCTDGVRSSLPIVANAEGQIPVYVWLKDKACNSDHLKPAEATLMYDGTPPSTEFSVSGDLGGDGWYVSPVQVNLGCEDNASRCALTRYRIGIEPWKSGVSFTVVASGVVTFSYYSVDVAGNIEDTHTGSVKIDLDPPTSRAYGNSYSPVSSFNVFWDGADALSGIASFDVQYRIGVTGVWRNWVPPACPGQKSCLFTGGTPGKTYYFRSRAVDKAGNWELYPATPDTYVVVELLRNSGFEQAIGNEWELVWIPGRSNQATACGPGQRSEQSYAGSSTTVAVLGCPDEAGTEKGKGPPYGASMVCQVINVPGVQDMPAPVLTFRYRMLTYDVLWSRNYNRFYDSFNVGLGAPDEVQPTWVFTDGNKTQSYGTLLDLGWRSGFLDLKPYSGRAVKVCFANLTRVDELYDFQLNSWTYVDDVQLHNLENRAYIPVARRNMPVSVSAQDLNAAQSGHLSSEARPATPSDVRRRR